jgi:hypothetical protein
VAAEGGCLQSLSRTSEPRWPCPALPVCHHRALSLYTTLGTTSVPTSAPSVYHPPASSAPPCRPNCACLALGLSGVSICSRCAGRCPRSSCQLCATSPGSDKARVMGRQCLVLFLHTNFRGMQESPEKNSSLGSVLVGSGLLLSALAGLAAELRGGAMDLRRHLPQCQRAEGTNRLSTISRLQMPCARGSCSSVFIRISRNVTPFQYFVTAVGRCCFLKCCQQQWRCPGLLAVTQAYAY